MENTVRIAGRKGAMKMKTDKSFYNLMWALLVLTANALIWVGRPLNFVNPWFMVSYGIIMLSFLGQLIAVNITEKKQKTKNVDYHVKVRLTAYSALACAVICAAALRSTNVPALVAAIISIFFMVYEIVYLNKITAQIKSEEKKPVDGDTKFMTSFVQQAKALSSLAVTATGQADAKKVYDAIRYADQVSFESTADIELKLIMAMALLKQSLMNGDNSSEDTERLLTLLKQRNQIISDGKA